MMPHTLEAARRHAAGNDTQFEVVDDMDAAFEGADICYAKSWGPLLVAEQPGEAQRMVDEHQDWQCNERRMGLAHRSAVYMHCMPIDRGYEATEAVIDGPQPVICDEAENRRHVQKALMLLTMGGRG